MITLRDRDDGGERSTGLLSRQPYVREITAQGDQLHLYVEDGSTALPQLLRLLDLEQIGIRSMTLSEPTLDDVFLRQTGRWLRDTGPGDATLSKAGAAA